MDSNVVYMGRFIIKRILCFSTTCSLRSSISRANLLVQNPSFPSGMEQDPMAIAPPPCPQPAFCVWKNFSQRISLIREVRKQKQRKIVRRDQMIIMCMSA